MGPRDIDPPLHNDANIAIGHDADTLPKASTVARVGLAMYTFLIVYASLYPLSSWRDLGVRPSAFLFAPLPYYWTGFDVATNIIGYLPFGLLVVFALYPVLRGLPAALCALLAGALLSGSMEALQTYLPSRVPSNLDLITNFAGTVLGAVLALLLGNHFLKDSRLLRLRSAWFTPDAGRGLVVTALWPLAQLYPQSYLFGHGQLLPILSDWLSAWTEAPVNLGEMLRKGVQLSVQQYWLAETVITACGLTGALLTGACLLRKQAPKVRLMLMLLLAALSAKALTSALYFAPENAFAWLTPGAQGGLLFGAMMLSGLAYAPPAAQRRIAVASLLLSFAALNFVPGNPYFLSMLQTWTQGKFLNFNGAAHFLSLAWPFLALWFLLHPVHRLKR